MKTLIPTVALLLIVPHAVAQTDSTAHGAHRLELGVNARDGAYAQVTSESDSTEASPLVITTKRKKITIITEDKDWISEEDSVKDILRTLRTERRNQFTYWSGVDVGLNMLLGTSGSTNLPKQDAFMELDQINSRFVSINFLEEKIEFGSHHIGLLTGLGWEFTNYRLKANNLLQFTPDSIYAVPVETPQFRKNKLRQSGFRIPLMLEFNTKRAEMPTEADVMAAARDTVGGKKRRSFSFDNKKNFHMAVGVVGTWYYDSMYKQKYRLDGTTQKDIDKGEHYLLPYRLAAATRIGYGSLNLFAEYALTPLFEKNLAPELTPLTVGLTIVGFN